MDKKLWNILIKYNHIDDLTDSISRIIQGTQSDSDYMVIYGNYMNLDVSDTNELDSIVGEKIEYLLS